MNWHLLNPLRWKKSFLMALLGGFVVIWFVFLDTYSLLARWRLSNERAELLKKTEQLQAETVELEQKIEALQSDPQLLEKIAREEYGMRKSNEKVYRVKTQD